MVINSQPNSKSEIRNESLKYQLANSRKIFGEKIKKNNEQSQKSDHKEIPLVPAFEQGRLIVICVHFLFNNEMAIKPSTRPMSSPTFIRLMKIPIAKPKTIAATPAIFLLVISACWSLFMYLSGARNPRYRRFKKPSLYLVRSNSPSGDRLRARQRATHGKRLNRCKQMFLFHSAP